MAGRVGGKLKVLCKYQRIKNTYHDDSGWVMIDVQSSHEITEAFYTRMKEGYLPDGTVYDLRDIKRMFDFISYYPECGKHFFSQGVSDEKRDQGCN